MNPPTPSVRKTITALYCDLVSSTALADALDPEVYREVLSRYFEAMKLVIDRHHGRVEKFIGDAVTAVFGIPLLHEDDALCAVVTGLEMQQALEEVDEKLSSIAPARLEARIGINTGEVVVGDVEGGEGVVLGDVMNIAARLQAVASPGQVLLSETTYALVKHAIETEPVGPVPLRGKSGESYAYQARSAKAGEAGIPRRIDLPHVGRDWEVAQIVNTVERARRGDECRVVVVAGDPGIGKSRLVMETLRAVGEDALTAIGRCDPHSASNFHAVCLSLVRQLARREDVDEDDVSTQLRSVLDEEEGAVLVHLLRLLGLVEDTSGPRETAWAIRRLMEVIARKTLIVAVVEDVHWADPDLLELIEHIHEWGQGPIVLICTCRPELLADRPGWPSARALSLMLEPLADKVSRELIDSETTTALDREIVDEIADVAAGNPLFIEQLLSMVAEGSTRDAIQLPKSIEALIGARVERLSLSERNVLGVASVVGLEFAARALIELAEAKHEQLRLVMRKGFIDAVRGDAVEPSYRFHHALVHQVVYSLLPKSQRADLHQHVATWWENEDAPLVDRVERMGEHLERAHLYRRQLGDDGQGVHDLARRAASHLGAAGTKALGDGSARRASDLLSRAVQLLPEGDDQRLAMLWDLGTSLTDVGALRDAAGVLDEAISEARAWERDALFWRATVGRLLVERLLDPSTLDEDSWRQVDAAIEALEQLGDDAGLAVAWRLFGIMKADVGHLEQAALALEKSRKRALAAGDDAMLPGLQYWRVILATLGRTPVTEALKVAQEVHEWVVRRLPRTVAEADALIVLGQALAMTDKPSAARDAFQDADVILQDFGEDQTRAYAALSMFEVEPARSDPSEAEQLVRGAYDFFCASGNEGSLSSAAGCLADAVYRQGRFDEALDLTIEAQRVSSPDDYDAEARWRRVRAKLLARQGRAEEAEALVREAVAIVERTDAIRFLADTLVDGAEVFALLGRDSDRVEMLRRALDLYELKGDVPSLRTVEALIK